MLQYFDKVWLYREMLAIPFVVAVLWVLWMKVVSVAFKEEKKQSERGEKK